MAKPDLTWDKLKATVKARARAFEASAVLGDTCRLIVMMSKLGLQV